MKSKRAKSFNTRITLTSERIKQVRKGRDEMNENDKQQKYKAVDDFVTSTKKKLENLEMNESQKAILKNMHKRIELKFKELTGYILANESEKFDQTLQEIKTECYGTSHKILHDQVKYILE